MNLCTHISMHTDCFSLASPLVQECFGCKTQKVCQSYKVYYESFHNIKVTNVVISMITGLFLGMVGMFILIHPKFKGKHPYPFIGLACVFEAIVYA